MRRRVMATIVVPAVAALCCGLTNIDPAAKWSWGENIGWFNWHDAGGGSQGVRVHATFLSGFAWGENVGWINLGDGTPVNGLAYANTTGGDAGVNIDPLTGNLFGLAWGENIGWINFDTRTALGASGQQARLDLATNRLRGYAWGENVGWINLDDATRFVAYLPETCSAPFADVDRDDDVDLDDFGVLQACLSGPGRPAPSGCGCLDRPLPGLPRGDNDVDLDDLARFTACRTAPAVEPDPLCGS